LKARNSNLAVTKFGIHLLFQVPEPAMPHNVSFGQNGLPPPFININSSPLSPISSVPSPGSVASSGHNPQSPFSLGPETPPPAYSPQDDKALLSMQQPSPSHNIEHQMDTNTSPGKSLSKKVRMNTITVSQCEWRPSALPGV
jgi:hypothetical protein